MNRVAFLVDGFNVYHSLREAQTVLERPVKWLDLRSLCASYVTRSIFHRPAVLVSVNYFSAYATFLEPTRPDVVAHHRAYVRALRARGVEITMGRFKTRRRRCVVCGNRFNAHEEKETDVAIAARMLTMAASNVCDTVVVVTGDTDLLPALRAARDIAPRMQLWVAFPYRRFNHELRQAADGHFKMRPQAYLRHQLPNPLVAPDGRQIAKPPGW